MLAGLLLWAGVSCAQSINGGCTFSPCKPSVTLLPSAVLQTDQFDNLSFGSLNNLFTGTSSGPVITDNTLVSFFQAPGLSANAVLGDAGFAANAANDIVRAVGNFPAGSTEPLNNSFGFYYRNSVPISSGFRTAVGYFGVGSCLVANSGCWGVNTVLTASAGASNAYLSNEFDINNNSSTATINAVAVMGSSAVTPAVATGFLVGSLSNQSPGLIPWSNGFATADGAANNALTIGLNTPTLSTNNNSQVALFAWSDNTGTRKSAIMQALGGSRGTLDVYGTALTTPVDLQLVSGGFRTANSTVVTNGLSLGATALSGTSIPSQFGIFNYFDSGGVAQNYNIHSDSVSLIFGGTAASPQFSFSGKVIATSYVAGSTAGVSCAAGTVSLTTLAVTNGIVTHC